ncbi:MAG: hypothetical protein NTY19_50200 [Planctomycetota bacterium]|nr:hypothetical protein [Planctomycetota bacterium]
MNTRESMLRSKEVSVQVACAHCRTGGRLVINGDPAGRSVGFDISVAVANQSGDRRERAMHWAGLSEGVVVDRPGSAELVPRTWGTLNFAPR